MYSWSMPRVSPRRSCLAWRTDLLQQFTFFLLLSSPRAESARAVTGRRYPHSGEGEDFLTGQPVFFFTKTAVTLERKVGKSFPGWEMNNHSEGYKRTVDQNWGRMAKIGFLGKKPKFWAQKKAPTFGDSPCSGHDRKKLFKEKKCLCPNNQGGKCHFG